MFSLYETGEEPVADPFAALSAIPAATGTFRDMTGIRFEVPEFIAENAPAVVTAGPSVPTQPFPAWFLILISFW